MAEQDYGREFKDKVEQEVHERIHRDIHERVNPTVNRPKVMLLGDVRWGFVWGLVIVLVGTALLLHQLGILPIDLVARFWPMILVLFGVMNLTTRSGSFFGILLILAGIVLQLNRLGITHLSFADLWPMALIAVGLLLMWGSLETRGFLRAKAKAFQDFKDQVTGATVPLTMLNAVAVFGGCERRVAGENFQGGRATAVFGGIELDFRDADMQDEAILEINCVFGGVEIRVPETWHVHSRNLPVFGGYEDKTRHPNNPAVGSPKTLIVTGMVIFGGIEIKN
jgi:predicted membrane protein